MAAPSVSISESGSFGLTNIDNAEAASAWAGFNDGAGGSPSVQDEGDIFIQDTQAVSIKISGNNQNKGMWYDTTTGVDMTLPGRHLYVWAAYTTPALLATIDATVGGIYVKVASDASGANWNKYYVAGSDTLDPTGLFVRYVIDLNKTPSATAATAATLTSIRWFGVGAFHTTGTVKSENLIVDRMDYGDGFQISGGQTGDFANWEALYQADNNTSNKYGIIEKRSGVYYMKGGLTIGDTGAGVTGTVWSDDTGATVVFEDPKYYNGSALVSAVTPADLYKIELNCNGSSTNSVDFGTVVGTGNSRQGILGGTIRSDGPKWTLDAATDIADWDTINFYGVTFQGAGITEFDSDTKTDVIGCSWVNCDEAQVGNVENLNCFVIAPVPDRGIENLAQQNQRQITFVAGSTDDQVAMRCWQVDVTGADTFVEMTSEFEDATANNCVPFLVAGHAINDYFGIGHESKFAKVTINTGTARSGGTLVWRYPNSISTWADLTIISDGTNTLSTTGSQVLTFEVPNDWFARSLNGESPIYYIGPHVTVTMTTNPLITQGTIGDVVEHHLHASGGAAHESDDLEFFGFSPDGGPKWMAENSRLAVLTDSYAFTNQDATTAVGDTTTAVGQSVTGDGGFMCRARFELTKVGSPTGFCRAHVYAHSGTFGTSSVPTGAPLVTSNDIDVSTLSASATEVDLGFQDSFQTVNLTKYVLVFEYTTGSSGNTISVGTDTSTPSHGGNFSTFAGSWSAVAGTDMVFEFVSGGRVIWTNTGTSNLTEAEIDETADVPACSWVVDNKSITFTNLVVNSEVRVYLAGTSTEVDGIESTAGSTFNFTVGSGVAVDYVIFGPIVGSTAYVAQRQENQSWTVDTSIVVNQQIDRNYNDPD